MKTFSFGQSLDGENGIRDSRQDKMALAKAFTGISAIVPVTEGRGRHNPEVAPVIAGQGGHHGAVALVIEGQGCHCHSQHERQVSSHGRQPLLVVDLVGDSVGGSDARC